MKKSFTLIEVLLAIFISTLGISGGLSLLSSQMNLNRYIENASIAAFLAEEGIEIVRNIRETNWINHQDWDENINLNNATTTLFDYTSTSIPDTNFSSCEKLWFDGFYNCSSGRETPFKREIFILKSGDEMIIRVTVSWKDKGKNYQYSITGKIYNYW